jgi:predicted dienelactone hydrolase
MRFQNRNFGYAAIATRKRMNRRLLLTLLAVTVIAACAPAPVQPQPQPTVKLTPGYGSDSGNQAVGVIPEATIHDEHRNKNLSISVNYPIYGGPFPIIIFSHGYGGSKNGYEPLAAYWTSFGYVVIRPSHADANVLREVYVNGRMDAAEARSQGGGTRGGRGGRRETPPPAVAGARAVARSIEDIWEKEREPQWRDRAADISLVIDSLGDLEQRFPELRGKMDHVKIGVGGHSYGAFTTMLVAGVKPLADPPFSAGDPRVTAAVAMSPQGVSASRGLIPESWKGVTIPMLYMTGSNDNGPAEGEDPAWRRTAYVHSPAGDKYFVEIEGADHMSFTGRLGGFALAPRLADQPRDPMGPGGRGLASTSAARPNVSYTGGRNTFRYVRDVSVAFWDTYLKGDTKAKDYLQNKVGSDVVKVERK